MLDEGLIDLLPENLAHKFLFLMGNNGGDHFSSEELERLKNHFMQSTICTSTSDVEKKRHEFGQHSISILPMLRTGSSSDIVNALRFVLFNLLRGLIYLFLQITKKYPNTTRCNHFNDDESTTQKKRDTLT